MSAPVSPSGDRFMQQLADLQRRVRDLEAAAGLGSSSIREGQLAVVDATNTRRVAIGTTSTGGYGVEVYDAAGDVILRIDDNGLRMYDGINARLALGLPLVGVGRGLTIVDDDSRVVFDVDGEGNHTPTSNLSFVPQIHNTAADNETGVDVTGGSFQTYYEARGSAPGYRGISVEVWAIAPVGTTGELRLESAAGTSGVHTVASGSSSIKSWDWLHGDENNGWFQLQARITSGAGPIRLVHPYDAVLRTPSGCTANGL